MKAMNVSFHISSNQRSQYRQWVKPCSSCSIFNPKKRVLRLTCCVPNCTQTLSCSPESSAATKNQQQAGFWFPAGFRLQVRLSCLISVSTVLRFPLDFYAGHNSLSMMHNESGELSGNIFSQGPLSSTFFKTHFTVELKRVCSAVVMILWRKRRLDPQILHLFHTFFTWK